MSGPTRPLTLPRRRFVLACAGSALIGPVTATAQVQPVALDPRRPIKLVLPFAADDGSDAIARVVAQALGERLKTSVLLDRQPAGNGAAAAESVARAAADGHTLLLAGSGTQAVNPALVKRLPYDPQADFAPVAHVGRLPLVLIANPALPVDSAAELVDYAKANPGLLSYASGSGAGWIAAATLARLAGLEFAHAAYPTLASAIADLIGGRVSWMFVDLAHSLGAIKADKVNALAVGSAQASPLLPKLPPLAATPLFQEFDLGAWLAVLAPAATPAAITNALNAALVRLLGEPAIRAKLAGLGLEALGSTPEELSAFMTAERANWARLAREGKLQPS